MLTIVGLLGLTWPSPLEVVVRRGGERRGLLNSNITVLIS